MANFTLHFDGSCWPNPGGTAAYGIVLKKEHLVQGQPYGDSTICAEAGVIGTEPKMSNNVAEFYALATGLERFLSYPALPGDRLEVFGDSNLVIQIMRGTWRASSDKLYYPAWGKAALNEDVLKELGVSITYTWIPREANTECDDLSKEHNKATK